MSSTEVVLSPTKKKKQQKMEQQIVSSDVTNDECNLMDSINDDIIDENNSESDESVNQKTLISNLNETNKTCHVDTCMEPLLIQDCVVVHDEMFVTNPINETNCAHIDVDDTNNSNDDTVTQHSEADAVDDQCPTPDSGGGYMKANLSLNLNNENILNDDKSNLPKNKKFLESSEDQIMNQIFFQTITVTPTADDDVLATKFLSNDINTPSEVDSDLIDGPVDFFNRKIDEDEAFDTTYTDTADNYQENDGNLCSLNDNFNENYCSFSSIDYNTNVQNENVQEKSENVEEDESPENDLLQPDKFLGEYAEQMRQQRPSIVIDCYDSDSKTEEDDNIVIVDEKINDYCFYFDQTIEEDDDDPCYISDNIDDARIKEIGKGAKEKVDENGITSAIEAVAVNENGKTLDEQGEEDDIDECFETEDDEIFNDDDNDEEEEDVANDDKSASDDEGVINESCLSVNVSGCNLTRFFLSHNIHNDKVGSL